MNRRPRVGLLISARKAYHVVSRTSRRAHATRSSSDDDVGIRVIGILRSGVEVGARLPGVRVGTHFNNASRRTGNAQTHAARVVDLDLGGPRLPGDCSSRLQVIHSEWERADGSDRVGVGHGRPSRPAFNVGARKLHHLGDESRTWPCLNDLDSSRLVRRHAHGRWRTGIGGLHRRDLELAGTRSEAAGVRAGQGSERQAATHHREHDRRGADCAWSNQRSALRWGFLLTLTFSLFDSAAVQAALSSTWARNSKVFFTFFFSEKLPWASV